MRLLVTSEDYTVHKVLAAARLAGIRLGQPVLVQQQQLAALHPLAQGMLLEVAGGHVAQHHAILRYIAEAAPAAYLYGRSDFQQAEVRTSTCAFGPHCAKGTPGRGVFCLAEIAGNIVMLLV
jgi:hypothetical protein